MPVSPVPCACSTSVTGVGLLVLATLFPYGSTAFGPDSNSTLRVGSWNVFYKALDDQYVFDLNVLPLNHVRVGAAGDIA
jgi:hypothetical protein